MREGSVLRTINRELRYPWLMWASTFGAGIVAFGVLPVAFGMTGIVVGVIAGPGSAVLIAHLWPRDIARIHERIEQ